ncbi:oxygenase MpaB family protein [Nocardia sp. NPDC051900]|uniref:oxygenase MpaB family protein n=1 Tax=Nocardia sp. NPDC051900 TaxID=3364326 RepID=UPI0037931376
MGVEVAMVQIAYSDRDLRSLIHAGHAHVQGSDVFGTRYHALRPDLFFFQHATYGLDEPNPSWSSDWFG